MATTVIINEHVRPAGRPATTINATVQVVRAADDPGYRVAVYEAGRRLGWVERRPAGQRSWVYEATDLAGQSMGGNHAKRAYAIALLLLHDRAKEAADAS